MVAWYVLNTYTQPIKSLYPPPNELKKGLSALHIDEDIKYIYVYLCSKTTFSNSK